MQSSSGLACRRTICSSALSAPCLSRRTGVADNRDGALAAGKGGEADPAQWGAVVLQLVLEAEVLACWHTIRWRCEALAVATDAKVRCVVTGR